MAKIEVRFVPETKISNAGREYQILEMWVTDRDGGWPERPTSTIMPFHARLLLQNLPEFCQAITDADRIKEGGEPESANQAAEEPEEDEDCPF